MNFTIEIASSNKTLHYNPEDETIAEALHSIYWNDERKIKIIWNHAIIIITIGCLADLYSDIVSIIKKIHVGENFSASFLSSELTSIFDFKIKENTIKVHANWRDTPPNTTTDFLNTRASNCEFQKDSFILQLLKIVDVAKNDLIRSGYGNFFNKKNPFGINLH